jgi:calcineurin-like phosphoesterase family protein
VSKIFLTSDTHFGHDRKFLYGPRGFNNIQEHDETIIQNWNSVVSPEDIVFHLGDVMLNDNEHGMECLRRLNGKIIIIPGNHDTRNRIELYKTLPNISVIQGIQPDGSNLNVGAIYYKYNKYTFYMSHHPTNTSNLEGGHYLRMHLLNLYGHTHQNTNFYNEIPYMYHVGMDSHNCYPVCIDDIIEDMKIEVHKCIEML